jgi:uncharacterized lipoprotein YajG
VKRFAQIVWYAGFMAVTGCAATGEVITLNVQTIPSQTDAAKRSEVNVAVLPFEDARAEQGRLGSRAHLWGGRTYFEVPGGKPSDAVADAVADYLKAKGWKVYAAKSTDQAATGKADVLLSGKLLALAVDAESKFARTNIAAKSKIAVHAQNAADGSTVRMTLNGAGSQSVFWFSPEDAQKLLNEVLTESLEKLVLDTKVENHALRLK